MTNIFKPQQNLNKTSTKPQQNLNKTSTKPQQNFNRIEFIDIAKGIAIICVILGHLDNFSIGRFVYSFHMPIFFIITGYFINAKRDMAEFIKSKAKILLIPYLITSILCIICGSILEGNDGFFRWSLAALYGSGIVEYNDFAIITHYGIGAIWFLWATFFASIFLRTILEFNKYLRILSIFALFKLGYEYKYIWLPFSIQPAACATLFMYLGYSFKKNQEQFISFFKTLSQEIKVFYILFALMIWLFFIKDFRTFYVVKVDFGSRGDILASLCGCIIILLLSQTINKIKYLSKFLAYFGKYSLLVLCFHQIEYRFFPWWEFADKIIELTQISLDRLGIVIISKLSFDLTVVYILSKIPQVRKLFGYKN